MPVNTLATAGGTLFITNGALTYERVGDHVAYSDPPLIFRWAPYLGGGRERIVMHYLPEFLMTDDVIREEGQRMLVGLMGRETYTIPVQEIFDAQNIKERWPHYAGKGDAAADALALLLNHVFHIVAEHHDIERGWTPEQPEADEPQTAADTLVGEINKMAAERGLKLFLPEALK